MCPSSEKPPASLGLGDFCKCNRKTRHIMDRCKKDYAQTGYSRRLFQGIRIELESEGPRNHKFLASLWFEAPMARNKQ